MTQPRTHITRELDRRADRDFVARRQASAPDVGRIARSLAASGLVVVMAVGGLAVWTLIPLGGLWLASQLSDSYAQLPMVPVLAAAVGIPAAMALAGEALAWLERVYVRLTGATPRARGVPAWRRSLSDSYLPAPASVLEKIMVTNALLAVGVLVIWFFVFAGSSLPA
jgi:hypothetical protein